MIEWLLLKKNIDHYIKTETINDALYYLNKLDFTDKVDDSDYGNLRCVKRIVVEQFED